MTTHVISSYFWRKLAPLSMNLPLKSVARLSPDSFVMMLRCCANLKAIRYESTSLNRVVSDKSHRVIVALNTVKLINYSCVRWPTGLRDPGHMHASGYPVKRWSLHFTVFSSNSDKKPNENRNSNLSYQYDSLWTITTSDTIISKIQRLQNKLIRLALGLPKYISYYTTLLTLHTCN